MTQLRFDDQVVVITGAGGGLGRQHAMAFAARGAKVVCNDLGGSVDGQGSDTGPAQAIAHELCALGAEAIADTNSVTSPEGGEAIIATALDTYGRVDVLVNNAGILRDKSFANMTADLSDSVIDVHLRGAFYVTRPAWVAMKTAGYGRIINTASQSGLIGAFGQANYAAAKMGLVGFTRTLAAEGVKYGIGVNAIAPLAVTRMTEELLGAVADKFVAAQISPAVVMLASRECSVTGEIFAVAAGRIARYFVGLTHGWYDPELSAESALAHLDEIRNLDSYFVPNSPADEVMDILKFFA
jgi:NAD(P)-dependent dehydrogenase (short-subunit alcohol dehydrogenase family)